MHLIRERSQVYVWTAKMDTIAKISTPQTVEEYAALLQRPWAYRVRNPEIWLWSRTHSHTAIPSSHRIYRKNAKNTAKLTAECSILQYFFAFFLYIPWLEDIALCECVRLHSNFSGFLTRQVQGRWRNATYFSTIWRVEILAVVFILVVLTYA